MDLPTYTSIWRIEKRLYKLYDFRLPMPLPVGQIAVFVGLAVPYVILLTVLGLPVNHTLFWLYVLPPGVLTWLATRPVLESKRLPELIISQVRYLSEPRTWCRMAPLAEKDEVVVVARVWRRAAEAPQAKTVAAGPQQQPALAAETAEPAAAKWPLVGPAVTGSAFPPVGARLPAGKAAGQQRRVGAPGQRATQRQGTSQGQGAPSRQRAVPGVMPRDAAAKTGDPPVRARAETGAGPAARAVPPAAPAAPPQQAGSGPAAGPAPAVPGPQRPESPPSRPEPAQAAPGAAPAASPAARSDDAAAQDGASAEQPAADHSAAAEHAGPAPAAPAPAAPESAAPESAAPAPQAPAEPGAPPPAPGQSPIRIVPAGPSPARPARQVERALSSPVEQRSMNWRDHVTVVPGGHGPGRPDYLKRDQARATVPIDGPRLVVVLGCTVGAGQTVTTLMLADLLARLRNEPVAALDFNPGPASLAEQARVPPAATVNSLLANGSAPRPAGHLGHLGSRGRGHVDVIAHDAAGNGAPQPGDDDHRRLQHLLADRYPLTLSDPGAAAVARLLAVADQLVLVAPASPDASQATAMTQEWLQSNGYGALTAEAVVVINGVSKRSTTHTEQAEAVVRGRCRAIVRVPWDDHLGAPPAEQGIRDIGAAAGSASRLEQLRPPVLQAYTALAGVLVSALATSTGQRRAVR